MELYKDIRFLASMLQRIIRRIFTIPASLDSQPSVVGDEILDGLYEFVPEVRGAICKCLFSRKL